MSFLALSSIVAIVLSILTMLSLIVLGDPYYKWPNWLLVTVGGLVVGSTVAVGTALIAAVVRFL